MRTINRRLNRFFLNQTVWMFFTVILFVSILLVKDAPEPSWSAYLSYLLSLSLLYAPVLFFSGFRNRLRGQWGRLPFRLLWGLCFLIYPMLLATLGYHIFDRLLIFSVPGSELHNSEMDWVVTLGVFLLLTELAIQGNNYWNQRKTAGGLLKKINLEQAIVFLLLGVAMLAAAVHPGETVYEGLPGEGRLFWAIPPFISYTLQFFLILLVYYFFYFVNHYVLVPVLLKNKGIVFYGFGLAGTVLLLYPVFAQLMAWLPVVSESGWHPAAGHQIFADANAFIPFFLMVFSLPFILTLEWFKQSSAINTLEREKSASELNMLRQQVNPHFFFNTLNNLYALSIKQDATTPQVILQLSKLMRYVIYKGKEETVTLAEEIRYIEDYVQLQQIRLHKRLDFCFKQNLNDEELLLPPLLFIILVENAFKHGIEPAEKDAFLHLRMDADENQLTFTCQNSMEQQASKPAGIGLNNLRQRLALQFPGRHELLLEEGEGTFKAALKLFFL